MRLGSSSILAIILATVAISALPSRLISQEPGSRPTVVAEANPPGVSPAAIPDAPQPQIAVADSESFSQQTQAGQSQSAQQPAPDSAAAPSQSGSGAKPPAGSTDAEKSQREKAEEQLKAQEHQRVMGVMATFNTTRNKDALPLSTAQKFQLFFKSETDPWPFLLAGVVSGIGQADNSYAAWGQGFQGYAKRYGAAYSDAFIGNLFGNAVLTSLLREDPRYFQKGSGKFLNRALWAAASTVWCRRDNGRWGPNYANVGGNLIGAAVARLYYPASERNVSDTISDGFTVSAEGIVGSEVIEFWPDIARHHQRKKAEKAARLAAQAASQSPSQPDSQSADKNQNQPQK